MVNNDELGIFVPHIEQNKGEYLWYILWVPAAVQLI